MNIVSDIPYGYCQCGCGQKTKISTHNRKDRNHVKGEPLRFIFGHVKPEMNNAEIFWSRIAITADDECWLWLGACEKNGYARIGWDCHYEYAHRVSWIITNGDIPDNLFVLHTCDVRNCVNPKHLFLGTHQDNMGDMVAKGRQLKGESNGSHKLTAKQVVEIRERYALGDVSWAGLATMYDISKAHIGRIVNNTSWKE